MDNLDQIIGQVARERDRAHAAHQVAVSEYLMSPSSPRKRAEWDAWDALRAADKALAAALRLKTGERYDGSDGYVCGRRSPDPGRERWPE